MVLGSQKDRPGKQELRSVFFYSLAISIVGHSVPLGLVIGIPLQCIATLVHELGHGGTALLVGADFYSFSISPDGSGAAFISGDSGVGSVLIGASGLVGPAIVGGLFYVLALRPLSARIALGLVSLLLLVVEFTVVSGGFSLFFVGTLCVICAVLALSRSILPQAAMIFLAIQLSLSLFWDWSYLFANTEVCPMSHVCPKHSVCPSGFGGLPVQRYPSLA